MNGQEITIREIESLEEMRAVEELQREVWGMSDLDILPTLHLHVTKEAGGLLIGAYEGNELIGFVYGLIGLEESEVILHSDMTGVRRGHRDQNLGYRLKLAQRDWALQRGITRVTWTFDPLQSRNAYLNFNKLGVVADFYKVNYYGETSSFLHQLGTDRFRVSWHLMSDRVKMRLSEAGGTTIPQDYLSENILVHCDDESQPSIFKSSFADTAFIEIPENIGRLQETDRSLALKWREVTREVFTERMSSGFIVENYHRIIAGDRAIGVYELRLK